MAFVTFDFAGGRAAWSVALISVLETTVNFATVPLNVTFVEPVRLVPRNNHGRAHFFGGG